jgi:hypothetical protein
MGPALGAWGSADISVVGADAVPDSASSKPATANALTRVVSRSTAESSKSNDGVVARRPLSRGWADG